MRGEKTSSPTLGQEVLSQRADLGRTNTLSESLEEVSTRIFGNITQLYKVFALQEHMVKHLGSDGQSTYIKFSRDKIEDGIEIRVRAGSLEPEDKLSDRNEAVDLAKTGKIIDPLTFAEKWHLPKPMEAARRSFYYMFMPDRYASEILKVGQPEGMEEAFVTIRKISAGEFVPGKEDATSEYLQGYSNFVNSDVFKQLDPEVQRLHTLHLKETVEIVKRNLKEGLAEEPRETVMSTLVKKITRRNK